MLKDLIEYLQVEREELTWIEYDADYKNTVVAKNYFIRTAESMLSSVRYDKLDKTLEYGLCSTIVGSSWYIQQIDCKTDDLAALTMLLDPMKKDYRVYSTGNSFHVYFRKLANPFTLHGWWDKRDLNTYLAELLLADTDGLLDHRWMAHCIVDKCTTLRFTQHQNVKLQVPELVLDRRFR